MSRTAGGATSTLVAVLIAVACAGIVLPPLAALYWFTQTRRLPGDRG